MKLVSILIQNESVSALCLELLVQPKEESGSILNISKLCIFIQVSVLTWEYSGFSDLTINEFSKNS